MNIYFNMTWMEGQLRTSVYNTILNSEYDIGEVWCNVTDKRKGHKDRRAYPFDLYPVWKSAKTTCLGKYSIQISSYKEQYHKDVSNLWDKEGWLHGLKESGGWKVWNTKPKYSVPDWANKYYGGTHYDFRIQAKKSIVEPSRAIQEAVYNTTSLQYGRNGVLLEHKYLFGFKDPWMVEVTGFNDFRTVCYQSGWKYDLQPHHINHWEASVQTVLKNNGFSNVSFNIELEIDEEFDVKQMYIMKWRIL